MGIKPAFVLITIKNKRNITKLPIQRLDSSFLSEKKMCIFYIPSWMILQHRSNFSKNIFFLYNFMATASFNLTLFNVSCVLSEYQKSSLLKVYLDLSKLRKFSPVI